MTDPKLARPHVLLVGHCSFDGPQIERLVRSVADVEVTQVQRADDAKKILATCPVSLVLVNRVFDADGDSGIEFIRSQSNRSGTTRLMLVSNYQDAQEEAIRAGGIRGFGKSDLGDPATASLLKANVAADA